MKRIFIGATVLCLTSVPLEAKTGAPPPGAAEEPAVVRALSGAKGLGEGAAKGGPTCNSAAPPTIGCNTTVTGILETTDCALDDGTVADFWVFDGTAGDEVTIDLESDEFDTFLFLLDPSPEVVAVDDDGGGGTNSRIAFQLDLSGEWAIAANNFAALPGDPGTYSLTLSCGAGCAADENTLCLNRQRFQVEIEWRDFSGGVGPGSVAPLGSDDSGLFWFFSPNNWEMLVKVLDGCGITGHFWVFAAATTNVEYTLRVTDTETGTVKEYFNPLGQASPTITDTSAFATCP